jgi:hypothetical protein
VLHCFVLKTFFNKHILCKMMNPVMVVIFSVFDIILGMTSVGVQVKYTFSISVKYHFLIFLHLCNNVQRENSKLAALILYTRISNFVDVNYDVVAHGIWCGFIYIGAGSQGLYSSYNRPQA